MSSHIRMAYPCRGNTTKKPEGIEKEWTADKQKKMEKPQNSYADWKKPNENIHYRILFI